MAEVDRARSARALSKDKGDWGLTNPRSQLVWRVADIHADLGNTMIVRIQGKTRQERHGITSAASDAVGEAGGYIVDFRQFSNLAVVFTIELAPAGYGKLREKLSRLGVLLEPPSSEERALAGLVAPEEVRGSLRLDFQHQEPDLRIPIPAVPG